MPTKQAWSANNPGSDSAPTAGGRPTPTAASASVANSSIASTLACRERGQVATILHDIATTGQMATGGTPTPRTAGGAEDGSIMGGHKTDTRRRVALGRPRIMDITARTHGMKERGLHGRMVLHHGRRRKSVAWAENPKPTRSRSGLQWKGRDRRGGWKRSLTETGRIAHRRQPWV